MKTYKIKYTREAKKRIQNLDPLIRNIVCKAIESLQTQPFRGKALSYQLAGLRSLRTSDYRIIYKIRGQELVIIVITVGHRRDVYQKLKALLERESE